MADNEAIYDGTNLAVGTDLSAFGTLIPLHAAVARAPEPSTLALFAAGAIAGFAVWRTRKRLGA